MAVDYFLDIDGIAGESKDAGHTSKIDVLSFSWGASQPGTFGNGSGGTAGKVNMSDLSFTMQTCQATPKLMQACATGQHINKAVLYCRKSSGDGGQQDYITWTFSPVIISSYHTGGSSGAEIPVDSVAINYGSVKFEYKKQADDSGNVTQAGSFGWSLEKNQKLG
jgi:type VI secretion system secreted protein Hcp